MFAKLRHVPLQQLLDFVASAESLTFGSAAKRLNRPVRGILQSVHKLEELFGAKLFRRLPTPIRMIAEGKRLVPHARAVVDCVTDLISRLGPKDGNPK